MCSTSVRASLSPKQQKAVNATTEAISMASRRKRCFVDYVKKRNHYGQWQKRILFVVPDAVFSCTPQGLPRRCITLSKINRILLGTRGSAIIEVESEYDYLFRSPYIGKMVDRVGYLYLQLTGRTLVVENTGFEPDSRKLSFRIKKPKGLHRPKEVDTEAIDQAKAEKQHKLRIEAEQREDRREKMSKFLRSQEGTSAAAARDPGLIRPHGISSTESAGSASMASSVPSDPFSSEWGPAVNEGEEGPAFGDLSREALLEMLRKCVLSSACPECVEQGLDVSLCSHQLQDDGGEAEGPAAAGSRTSSSSLIENSFGEGLDGDQPYGPSTSSQSPSMFAFIKKRGKSLAKGSFSGKQGSAAFTPYKSSFLWDPEEDELELEHIASWESLEEEEGASPPVTVYDPPIASLSSI